MKVILKLVGVLILTLNLTSCSKKVTEIDKEQEAALSHAIVLVEELNQKIEIGYPISAAAFDGIPVVLVEVADPKSDFRSTARKIIDAIGDPDRDVKIVYQTDSELTESDKQSGLKAPKNYLATYEVKAGNTQRSSSQEEKTTPADTNVVTAPEQQSSNPSPNPYEGIPDNRPVIHQVRGGELGEDGWCLAKSTRGNFSVMLPGQYMDSMLKMPTTKGGTGVMHTVASKSPDGIEFNVLFSEIIGEMPDENPLEGMANRFKQAGATVTRSNMVLAGLPAVRMNVLAPGTAAEIIHVDATNGYFMLAAQARPPQPDNPKLEADIERFFRSFKILDRPGATPAP